MSSVCEDVCVWMSVALRQWMRLAAPTAAIVTAAGIRAVVVAGAPLLAVFVRVAGAVRVCVPVYST